MQLAAYHGHTDLVKYLIQQGADVNAVTNVRGRSAGLHATAVGHCGAHRLPDLVAQDGMTAAALAEEGYEEETAEVLKVRLVCSRVLHGCCGGLTVRCQRTPPAARVSTHQYYPAGGSQHSRRCGGCKAYYR